MKRKFLICTASFFILLSLCGCSNYSNLETMLNEITIENRLPDIPSKNIKSLQDAEDYVYEQQLAVCDMLSDSYNKTYYQNFVGSVNGKEKKIAQICNDKRVEIDNDIELRFYRNIYSIIENAQDCTNKDAYAIRAYENVQAFYDAYYKYNNSENKDIELTNILVDYNERNNVLALSFLSRKEAEVFKSSVAVIEGNADTDSDFRYYVNINNAIIKALNNVYEGVPEEYASRISDASTKLAINLINSMDNLSDKERLAIMQDMDLVLPSPSPKPSPTPTLPPTPSPVPTSAPTPRPAATPAPATQRPATQRPATQAPVVQQPVQQQPVQQQPVQQQPVQQDEPEQDNSNDTESLEDIGGYVLD